MSWYHIVAADDVVWSVDVDFFVDNLRRSWPQASIDSARTASIVLSWEIVWEIDTQESRLKSFLVGVLSQDLQSISVTGNFEACIDFFLWYRSLIPKEYRLLFRDEPLTTQAELRPETSRGDIIQSFKPSLSSMEWMILHAINGSHGKAKVTSLLEILQIHFADISDEILFEQIEESINILWKQDLVTFPSAKWLSIAPQEIGSILLSVEFKQSELSITDVGRRALKARPQYV